MHNFLSLYQTIQFNSFKEIWALCVFVHLGARILFGFSQMVCIFTYINSRNKWFHTLTASVPVILFMVTMKTFYYVLKLF
jgi:hypothetical protein